MTCKELYDLLLTTNLPVVYDHFDGKIEPPFIVYFSTGLATLNADDKVYYKENKYNVILVTNKKDIATETTIETLFDNNYIVYTKYEDYIAKERIYQISYTI